MAQIGMIWWLYAIVDGPAKSSYQHTLSDSGELVMPYGSLIAPSNF